MTNILVLYYSMYGHVEILAKAVAEVTGGSPYGAGTLAGGDGARQPSENELKIARFQGGHVANIAKKQSA